MHRILYIRATKVDGKMDVCDYPKAGPSSPLNIFFPSIIIVIFKKLYFK